MKTVEFGFSLTPQNYTYFMQVNSQTKEIFLKEFIVNH